MINSNNRGFTLMETLVAILVLSIALAGPLTIAQKSLQASLTSKNQTTAFFLAQDAIEFIRYARDSNCLASASPVNCPAGNWLAGSAVNLATCVSANGGSACYIDTALNTVSICTSGICTTPLNYNSATNLYSYTTGTASIFTRTISIKTPVCVGASPCNTGDALITVVVSWRDPALHSVTLRESIFNWQ
jgi:prepilin-type N-terminal cleavage/methylation domain-containing protein